MGEKKEIIKIVYEYVVVEEDEDSGVFSEIVGEGRVLAKSADDVRLVVAAGLGPEQIEGKVVLVRPFCR